MTKDKTKGKMVFPKMSWEQPIEQEVLDFCRRMARQFREVEAHNHDSGLFGTGLFADNGFSIEAGHTAMAYETIANHIESQIELRSKL